ncbi:putative zinc-type alcohol dehydrogenase-like protein [Lewinella marina]|uniref:alcohol dehydrogenase (NADP(+)) n=1 Tax=Neolewinella marina TaxID=438751 RepID=A0A2G0CB81_9BACT|nr:NAD(P)-dependent alcohol dehydrogenase [Neolewinella marina]NJB87750.1 putative zinc-type alcohol dehydrogenase-like protein [Neolewinella marina]PHK97222.1 alcohol dehydrogenase [Neolewinella marina]
MSKVKAWAAREPQGKLEPFEYNAGPLGLEDVEVEIEYCGVCHSDLSMLDNEWGITTYPFVPGHEAIGKVVALGDIAKEKGLKVGQRVGVGWTVKSCLHCEYCLQGDQQMCTSVQPTIVGHHGAFAQSIRTHWVWAVPIPEGVSPDSAGPLLCGGITVFAPLLDNAISPTDKVGVFGIGGLGHMALKFLKAWGCETTAFTSSPSKHDEARAFGATHIASSVDSEEMGALAGKFDFIVISANASLDWDAIIAMLKPGGKLHIVGAVLEPIPVHVMSLMLSKRSISSSPTGNRSQMDKMMQFAAHHQVAPQVEHFPMSKVNEAMDHLRAGKASYRIVLEADY